MRLEATFTREDLQMLVAELMPVTIRLGQKSRLSLSDPSGLDLVADRGLRVACHAHGSWEVLGMSVPITRTSLRLLLEPSFAMRLDGDALVFKLQIESADIAMVPGVIAGRIVDLVNDELAAKHVELAWRFRKTLSHDFSLPASLENLTAIGLTATSGSLAVTHAALVFYGRVRDRRGTTVRTRGERDPERSGGSGRVGSVGSLLPGRVQHRLGNLVDHRRPPSLAPRPLRA